MDEYNAMYCDKSYPKFVYPVSNIYSYLNFYINKTSLILFLSLFYRKRVN